MYDRTSWKCVSTFTDDHHKEVSVCEGRRGLDVRGDSEVVPVLWAHDNYDAFLFYIRISVWWHIPEARKPGIFLVLPSVSAYIQCR